jgi:hypothetical protein
MSEEQSGENPPVERLPGLIACFSGYCRYTGPDGRHKYSKNSLGKKNRTAEEDQALDQEIARLNREAQDEPGPFRLLSEDQPPSPVAPEGHTSLRSDEPASQGGLDRLTPGGAMNVP